MVFFLIPLLIVGLLLIPRIRRSKEFLTALGFFGIAVALSVWSIMQSRSSTAAIGIYFWVLYSLPVAVIFGLARGLWGRGRPKGFSFNRSIASLLFLASIGYLGFIVSAGVSERVKNKERDRVQAVRSGQIDAYRKQVKATVATAGVNAKQVLDAEVIKNLNNEMFLFAALDYPFPELSPETISRAYATKLISHCTVSRNPHTTPELLVEIYENEKSNYACLQELASNPTTPAMLLEKVYARRGENTGVLIGLAGNKSTPSALLKLVAQGDDAYALLEILQRPDKPDCEIIQIIRDKLKNPDFDDVYKSRERIQTILKEESFSRCI